MGKKTPYSSTAASSGPSSANAPSNADPFGGAAAPKKRTKTVYAKSGNAGNSGTGVPPNSTAAKAQQAIDEGRPPPLFPVGYKTPLTLLNERCQKNGWQKPDLQPFKTPGGGHSCVIRLSRQDPKTGLETVTFRPPVSSLESSIALDKPTSLEAKHWGAVYTLHRFCSNLQMSMVLPPQCRDYWSALQADKKAVLDKNKNSKWMWDENPFEAQREQKARMEALNAKRNAAGAATGQGSGQGSAATSGRNTPVPGAPAGGKGGAGLGKDTPEVRMSTGMRRMVQETIRRMREQRPPVVPQDETIATKQTLVISERDRRRVLDNLQSLGYRKGHIESALKYLQSPLAAYDPLLEGLSSETLEETVLQYLQVILAEEELPGHHVGSSAAGANGTHANGHSHGYQGASDAKVRITKRHDKDTGLARSWLVEKIMKQAGYPEDVAEEAVEATHGSEGEAVAHLCKKLAGWPEPAATLSTDVDAAEVKSKLETEIEALESLLGNEVQRNSAHLDIRIVALGSQSTSKAVKTRAPTPPVILRVLLHESSRYPSPSDTSSSSDSSLAIPTFYLADAPHATVPPYIRLHLTTVLMQRITSDWLDIIEAGEGGIIYEMVTHLQETLEQVYHHPPPSQEVLRNLRAGDEAGLAEGVDRLRLGRSKHGSRRPGNRQDGGHRPPAGDSASLSKQYESLQQRSEYKALLAKRQSLPAFRSRAALIDLISCNRVVIVSGATGSGKTTQVPTYVLEDAIASMKGKDVNMVITQPRRISAIGVASRVAQERCEEVGKDGSLVGYAIRGERKAAKECRMLFCTTGILLQRLSRGGDPNLDNLSHVFVDEVHERSLDSDFLLLVLKEVLARNKRIKVVLMSATADSNRFSAYFNNAPCIEIPGQTFPVEDLYLEDVIQATRYKAPSTKASRKYTDEENASIRTSLIQQGIPDADLISTLGMLIRAEKMDFDLIAAAVQHIDEQYDASEAILVFVTGVAEIMQTIRAIERATSSSRVAVLPLHANLTNADQAKIFRPPPGGRRKVIVSTNVAETSITVDDVVHVIDTGRVKETRFEPTSGVQRLVEDWNSLAGSRQRRGRAGRTKPGHCWRLYARWQEENVIPRYTTPEILRTPLASLVLQVKALRGQEDVLKFLGNALDAPDVKAIQEALDTLTTLGAIDDSSSDEGGSSNASSTAKLTPLGQNLALLPLDLRLGKMLILASIFDCLEPMLYICAALSTKPLFASSLETRDAAAAARKRFSSGHSDLLTDMNAMRAILEMQDSAGASAKVRRFCEDNFISHAAWREILSLRSDFVSALKSAGFPVKLAQTTTSTGGKIWENVDDNLLKAIVYAGTAKAVRIKLPQVKYEATIGGTTQLDHEAKEVRFFDGDDGRVFLHPSSILFSEPKLSNGYLTYFSKSITSKPFLRDASELSLYALLLFGRGLRADAYRGGLSVQNGSASPSSGGTVPTATARSATGINDKQDDAKGVQSTQSGGKIQLRAPPRTSVLINELRRLMDLELEELIDAPELVSEGPSPVIQTMTTLLQRNGS